jgi:hypothetical protein
MATFPKTAFSLLYNATSVSAYRREAHEDLRVTFERFGVTDGTIQEACTRMENAAYELRSHSFGPSAKAAVPGEDRTYARAKTDLDAATKALFRALQPDIAWFLSSYRGISNVSAYQTSSALTPKEWLQGSGLLLDLVYHFLYVPGFAADAMQLQGLQVQVGNPVYEALQATHSVLTNGATINMVQAQAASEVLCAAMVAEYVEVGWIHCW